MAALAGPAPRASSSADGISPALTFVFALSCGALVANIYYAQALVTVISPALGLHAGLAGLTVTLTQLGFAAGLVLLVSLADLMENRRLILLCVAGTVIGFISAAFGWRAVFGSSAAVGVAIAVVLWFALPERRPQPGMSYGQILASSWHLLLTTPVLQRRALLQAIAFGTFNLFWTAVPLVLTQKFGFDQREIALFALAGAGGALAAPIAGRLADRGFTRPTMAVAFLTIIAAFALSGWAVAVTFVVALAVAAIALDASVQTGQILAQRVIYGIQPEARGRINAVFMTGIFVAGALGSLLAGVTFFYGGWTATAATGGAFGAILVVLFFLEQRFSTYPRYAPNATLSQ